MKKYLLILFVPLAFWACSKKDEVVVPELATPLVGVYNQSYYRLDTTAAGSTIPVVLVDATLPATLSGGGRYSASFSVRRDSASVIYVTLTEKETGYNDATTVIGQIKVSGTTPPYDLLTTANTVAPIFFGRARGIAGTKIGTCDGTNFNLDYVFVYGTFGAKLHEVYTARR
jgi:hypothetical protein